MNTNQYERLQAWIEKQSTDGLLDVKLALDNKAFSRREIIDGFLDAEDAVERNLTLPPPRPNGSADSKVLSFLSS